MEGRRKEKEVERGERRDEGRDRRRETTKRAKRQKWKHGGGDREWSEIETLAEIETETEILTDAVRTVRPLGLHQS